MYVLVAGYICSCTCMRVKSVCDDHPCQSPPSCVPSLADRKEISTQCWPACSNVSAKVKCGSGSPSKWIPVCRSVRSAGPGWCLVVWMCRRNPAIFLSGLLNAKTWIGAQTSVGSCSLDRSLRTSMFVGRVGKKHLWQHTPNPSHLGYIPRTGKDTYGYIPRAHWCFRKHTYSSVFPQAAMATYPEPIPRPKTTSPGPRRTAAAHLRSLARTLRGGSRTRCCWSSPQGPDATWVRFFWSCASLQVG